MSPQPNRADRSPRLFRWPAMFAFWTLAASMVGSALALECPKSCDPAGEQVCVNALALGDQPACKTDHTQRVYHHDFSEGVAVQAVEVGQRLDLDDRLSQVGDEVDLELLCPNGSTLKFSGEYEVVVVHQDPERCAVDLVDGNVNVQCAAGETETTLDQVALGCKGTRFAARLIRSPTGSLRRILVFEGDVSARYAGRQETLVESKAYALMPGEEIDSGPIRESEFQSAALLYGRFDVVKAELKGVQIADRQAVVAQFVSLHRAVLADPAEDSARIALANLQRDYGLAMESLQTLPPSRLERIRPYREGFHQPELTPEALQNLKEAAAQSLARIEAGTGKARDFAYAAQYYLVIGETDLANFYAKEALARRHELTPGEAQALESFIESGGSTE